MERLLKVTSRAFVVNPALLGALSDDPHQARDRFSSAFLLATATGLIRDVAVLTQRARAVEQRLATFTMDCEIGFASPAAFRAFTEELASQVATLASKYDRTPPRKPRGTNASNSIDTRATAQGESIERTPSGQRHENASVARPSRFR